MKLLKKFLPEVMSLYAGAAMWLGAFLMTFGILGEVLFIIAFQAVASVLSARFYHLFKRPNMWSYLQVQALVCVLAALPRFFTILTSGPIHLFAVIAAFITLVFFEIHRLMALFLPALIACCVYHIMFSSRFTGPAKGSSQP